MSSNADLLRRAAVALREAAEAATGGSWDADGTELYAENGSTWIGETSGDEPEDEANARLAALMHPPVALALANLLDHISEHMSYEFAEEREFPDVTIGANYRAMVTPDGVHRSDWTAAVAIARAVLREPEETRDA